MNTLSKMMMFVMIAGIASPAFAEEGKRPLRRKHSKVEQRVVNQERRIDNKEAKGKMTPEQAQAEREKVDAIASERASDIKANGGKPLNKDQRKKLQGELNQTSKEIKNTGAPVAPAAPAVPAGN